MLTELRNDSRVMKSRAYPVVQERQTGPSAQEAQLGMKEQGTHDLLPENKKVVTCAKVEVKTRLTDGT